MPRVYERTNQWQRSLRLFNEESKIAPVSEMWYVANGIKTSCLKIDDPISYPNAHNFIFTAIRYSIMCSYVTQNCISNENQHWFINVTNIRDFSSSQKQSQFGNIVLLFLVYRWPYVLFHYIFYLRSESHENENCGFGFFVSFFVRLFFTLMFLFFYQWLRILNCLQTP